MFGLRLHLYLFFCVRAVNVLARLRGQHARCADPEGRTGGPDPYPLKNHKNIGFLSNTGPDPPEKSQSYQARI